MPGHGTGNGMATNPEHDRRQRIYESMRDVLSSNSSVENLLDILEQTNPDEEKFVLDLMIEYDPIREHESPAIAALKLQLDELVTGREVLLLEVVRLRLHTREQARRLEFTESALQDSQERNRDLRDENNDLVSAYDGLKKQQEATEAASDTLDLKVRVLLKRFDRLQAALPAPSKRLKSDYEEFTTNALLEMDRFRQLITSD